MKDEVGNRYERLVVLSRASGKPNRRAAYWLCKCDCGKQTIVEGGALRSENTKSCGCYGRELRESGITKLSDTDLEARRRTRECRKCGERKAHTEFWEKRQGSRSIPQTLCRACYRRSHQDKRLRRYGLSRAMYESRCIEQGGLCAICECTPPLLFVDHSHITGEVRKLLCHQCNVILGLAKENPETLRKIAAYAAQYTKN